ncbi:hypothetical protein D3Y57_04760 (plasmid) [Sphingomonas paeninsulae]|uniref:Uncharacterized protein n=1 Tax=Sphingomonas paeninsulae TaxID=2319844 RepID=A0A494THP3_SPHPE|nr:hypothetical protein [Sphingomonas paeninsulae]AYJ85331.1 hypothetical protein D3Y57_04760 [Sphingomonas paeninsulae]
MGASEAGKILDEWRQGDFTLFEVPFPVLAHDDGGMYIIERMSPGAVVISQTCDIVQDLSRKQFVQIAALEKVDAEALGAASRLERPRYAYLDALVHHSLIVDLDRVATVDKRLVASWHREEGCQNDISRRAFSQATGRHKNRFAFPDAFVDAIVGVRTWVQKHRSKVATPRGQFIQALAEIRVKTDKWQDEPPFSEHLEFIGILKGDPSSACRKLWEEPIKQLAGLITDKFSNAVFSLTTYQDLSTFEYITSDRLDYDGLSPK